MHGGDHTGMSADGRDSEHGLDPPSPSLHCSNLCEAPSDAPPGIPRSSVTYRDGVYGKVENALKSEADRTAITEVGKELGPLGLHGSPMWCEKLVDLGIDPLHLRLPDTMHTLELGQLGRTLWDVMYRYFKRRSEYWQRGGKTAFENQVTHHTRRAGAPPPGAPQAVRTPRRAIPPPPPPPPRRGTARRRLPAPRSQSELKTGSAPSRAGASIRQGAAVRHGGEHPVGGPGVLPVELG